MGVEVGGGVRYVGERFTNVLNARKVEAYVAADATVGLDVFFGAKADLEKLLGRGVDLVEPAAIRNPYVLASINKSRESVYAA